MEFLGAYGYPGLFLAAFLAATILPFSSEILLGAMLAGDFHPGTTIACASAGNILGAVANYVLGIAGNRLVLEKIFRVSPSDIEQAAGRFRRYGVWSLLFAWVPVIGDPLTVVAGILKVNFYLFLVLVGIGKFFRYVVIAWAVL